MINVSVKPTNFNRFRFGSHTIQKILLLEGIPVIDGFAYIDGNPTSLDKINIIPSFKKKGPKNSPKKD